jgi:hypothetical protein
MDFGLMNLDCGLKFSTNVLKYQASEMLHIGSAVQRRVLSPIQAKRQGAREMLRTDCGMKANG